MDQAAPGGSEAGVEARAEHEQISSCRKGCWKWGLDVASDRIQFLQQLAVEAEDLLRQLTAAEPAIPFQISESESRRLYRSSSSKPKPLLKIGALSSLALLLL